MPKRKASAAILAESPAKRATRANRVINSRHVAVEPSTPSTKRIINRRGAQNQNACNPLANTPLKAKTIGKDAIYASSEDELILSPSKRYSESSVEVAKTTSNRSTKHTSPRLGFLYKSSLSPSPEKKKRNHDERTLARSPAPTDGLDAESIAKIPSLKFDAVELPIPRTPPPTESTPRQIIPSTAHTSLSKEQKIKCPPNRLPHILPRHLHPCLNAQKRVILRALQHPPQMAFKPDNILENEASANDIAFRQLADLLTGSIARGEGNSCLVLGSRGSGKTSMVERCISNFSKESPIILRLSGWIQHSDRLAMQEIAYQLGSETGRSFLASSDDPENQNKLEAEDANPFLDSVPPVQTSLPPSSHLPALISVLPTLARPTVVILDGFDLFALHPRQSLLYCLLDTVQSCRAVPGSSGLAVIGITNRIDTITMLEKRVKSRFSGRMFRCAPPRRFQDWQHLVRTVFSLEVDELVENDEDDEIVEEWKSIWNLAMRTFLNDEVTQTALLEAFSITQDVRLLMRLLASTVLCLSPKSPFPSSSRLAQSALSQQTRPRFKLQYTLHYPGLCLLISSVHADTAGHSTFTFEMLYDYFWEQVRASTAAPVQVNGGSIGMVRCSRQVLMSAFEDLINTRVFVQVNAHSQSTAKEFVKYRSVIDREEVKKAVDTNGQVNLKKWLTKVN